MVWIFAISVIILILGFKYFTVLYINILSLSPTALSNPSSPYYWSWCLDNITTALALYIWVLSKSFSYNGDPW